MMHQLGAGSEEAISERQSLTGANMKEDASFQSRRKIIGAAALGTAALAAGAAQAALPRSPSPTVAVVVLAQLDFANAHSLQQAIELARQVASLTQAEDGCLHYAYGVDVNVPTRLQLSEWWRDDGALQAHLHTPHLRIFRMGLRRIGGSSAKVRRFEVHGVADLKLPPLDG